MHAMIALWCIARERGTLAPVSRAAHFISECFCPLDKKLTREIGVWAAHLTKISTHFPPRMLHEFRSLVPAKLRSPDSLWFGVREPDPGEDGKGYCYAKRFPNKMNGEGKDYPNKLGHLFCVYVNADFMIYEFRWDEPDTADDRCPRDYRDRFKARVR